MKKKCAIWGISLFVTTLLLHSCQIHHGLEPIRSSISGTIFYNGSWPSTVKEVRVAATASFPPSDPLDLILSDPLPLNVDSTRFTIFVPPGTYVVLVIWKKVNSPWDVSSILGKYVSPSDSTKLGTVRVATENSRVEGINIAAEFPSSAISGTVTFVGEWPQNTEWVRLAVYVKKPRPNKIEDFFPPNLSVFSDPFPFGVESYDYLLPISAGTYEWILVAWKAKGTPLFEIKELGSYSGVVWVPETETISGINIVADFTKIK